MWATDVLHHLCLNSLPPLSSFLPSTPSSEKFTCLCIVPFLQSLHYPLLSICNIVPVYWQVSKRRLWGSMMMYLRFIDRGCSVLGSISIYWGHKHPWHFTLGSLQWRHRLCWKWDFHCYWKLLLGIWIPPSCMLLSLCSFIPFPHFLPLHACVHRTPNGFVSSLFLLSFYPTIFFLPNLSFPLPDFSQV